MFDWFKIYNMTEFLNSQLTSKSFIVFLEGVGQENIMITRGNVTSVVFREVLLPIMVDGKNPRVSKGVAVYLDESNDIWIGIEQVLP